MHRSAILYVMALLLLAAPMTLAAEEETEKKVEAQPVDTLAAMRHEIRNTANPIVTFETVHGQMVLELYHDVAPAHADSFLARTNDGFYSGMKIHRIVKGFMIQSGDPRQVNRKPVGYYLPDETSKLPHKLGTLSMASRGAPTTAQTQFFVCLGRNASTQGLDGGYVVFGQLLKGFDVLNKIGLLPVRASRMMRGEMSEPVTEIFLTKAYQSDAEGKPLK